MLVVIDQVRAGVVDVVETHCSVHVERASMRYLGNSRYSPRPKYSRP